MNLIIVSFRVFLVVTSEGHGDGWLLSLLAEGSSPALASPAISSLEPRQGLRSTRADDKGLGFRV